uniref:Acid phosphatase n=1 Tax=Parascaris univalens TaxID=6257 RepID=A0A915BHA7_PARUN
TIVSCNIMLELSVFIVSFVVTVHCDNLIMVQPIWRHGDRSPTTTFPNDPNQESAWPLGWGQLTPIGMDQQVSLGNALYEEYVVKNKFLSTSLSFNEMYIRSTDVNRTLISAYCNLIGMYYNRTKAVVDEDYPAHPRWPPYLVPFPVHTISKDRDYIGDPLAPDCPRRDWLLEMSLRAPEFVKLGDDNQKFLKELSDICGETIDLIKLWDIRDVILIEKLHNKSTVINDTMYAQIAVIDDQVENFEDGLGLSPVDGIDFAIEVPKVKGGGILWSILDHFDLKLFCLESNNSVMPQCRWMNSLKYFAYSAHDTTLTALMAAMGAKQKIIPFGYPTYAACLVFELWNTTSGPAIRVLFRRNYTADFEEVTHFINGCVNLSSNKCPYQRMHQSAETFYPGDVETLCKDVTSTSTDMRHQSTTAYPQIPTTSGAPLIFQSAAFSAFITVLLLRGI